jgi:hypothetical protein
MVNCSIKITRQLDYLHMVLKYISFLLGLISCCAAFSQITPPAGIGTEENIILWLSPDTATYNSSGQVAQNGEEVTAWHDISSNNFIFENNRNSRLPELTTYNGQK